MIITALSAQVRNPDRVNVSIDGKYRFSLDISQVIDFGIKLGREIDEAELAQLEQESEFGKLYAQALEYSLLRPHSSREMRDYLYRKTLAKRYRSKRTGEIKERKGATSVVTARVYDRLVERGYVDDEKFAVYWVEARNQTKGASKRKLTQELQSKGVPSEAIAAALAGTERSDADELAKVIAKKRARYPDEQKFKQYLMRQGFGYDDICQALSSDD